MSLRDDAREWREWARRSGARRVLDLGTGSGRVAKALREDERYVVGVDISDALMSGPRAVPLVLGDMRALPFRAGAFDRTLAANDPFAHLLTDADRGAAVREALRVSPRLVIDGLWLPAEDRSAAERELVRARDLGELSLRERWHRIGTDLYDTVYEYMRGRTIVAAARTTVRAWHPDETAISVGRARVYGGLNGEPFDPASSRLVIEFGAGS